MKKSILAAILIATILAFAAFAQDVAKNSKADKPAIKKELPATITIDVKQVDEINSLQKDAQIVAQQAEILNLRIESAKQQIAQAEPELAKLKDKAKNANDIVAITVAKAAKVPREDLGSYDIAIEKDGKWTLTKKPPVPPAPAQQ